jgi:hypothetical protein
MNSFRKFIQLTKVDEAKREVGGIVTAEAEDKDGEICEYKSTKPYYEEWSQEFAKATDGKSLGNLRVMHGLQAAGVGKALDFNDEDKAITMTFKVVDDDAWKGVQEGMYTGFSQGGNYIKQWKGKDGKQWYTAQPTEVSLVDNPALGLAHFEFIRANGQSEVRKFSTRSGENMEHKEVPAPGTGSVALTVSPETISEIVAKTTASVVALLKKSAEKVVTLMKDLTAEQQKTLRDVLLVKCTAIMAKAVEKRGVQKNMYDVSRFAQILCDLAYLRMCSAYEREYEGDASTIPDEIQQDLESLADTFLAMAQEETKELVTSAESAGKTGGMLMSTQAAALAKAAKDLADAAAEFLKSVAPAEPVAAAAAPVVAAAAAPPTPVVAAPAVVAAAAPVEKTYTAAELQDACTKAASDAANAAVQAVVKALTDGGEGEPEVEKTHAAKAAAGVGDRAQLPTVVANAGPAIRVMPVTKAQETTAAATPAVEEPVDMQKALSGDKAEGLKLMRSAKPTNTVPQTVASAIGGRRR